MFLQGKRVVVTGGTGSMGKTFVKRVLAGTYGTPEKVIVFSRDEGKHHAMRVAYQNRVVSTDEIIYSNFKNILEFRIGDIRNYADVCSAIRDAHVVINAAALKQVPACEYFPHQAIYTNCLGAANIVRAINENNLPVETVVGISTDKAAKPVNVMGMTKALQERIFVSANILNKKTRFVCVRYGNVLASRGSVIPLFHDQIKSGGPLTITVPEMTRFLISLDKAVDTVLAAIQFAKAGDTFIPIAPSATVMNIALALIGDRNVSIKNTGIRPGEKLHEILISDEEINHCERAGNYYAIRPMLPELLDGPIELSGLKKEFSSEDNVLDLEGTKKLLIEHDLLNINATQSASDQEFLR